MGKTIKTSKAKANKKLVGRAGVLLRRTPSASMQAAVNAVLDPTKPITVHKAATQFDVPYSSRQGYIAKAKAHPSNKTEMRFEPNYAVRVEEMNPVAGLGRCRGQVGEVNLVAALGRCRGQVGEQLQSRCVHSFEHHQGNNLSLVAKLVAESALRKSVPSRRK